MSESSKTQALNKAADKAVQDFRNYKNQQPQPTWSVETALGAEESINRLIKNSPVGSKKRQDLIDQKAAYKKKFEYWQNKYDAYGDAAQAALKAYQDSNKLDPLLKKQQDNKDTGIKDPKLDSKVQELQGSIKITEPKITVVPPAPPKKVPGPVDANNNGIPDSLEPVIPPKNTKTPEQIAAEAAAAAAKKAAEDKTAADKAAADKAAADAKAAAAKELALKTMYVDYLRSTFAGLEDKTQKAQIDDLMTKASTEGWTPEMFQMQLEGTSWWQTTLPSLRSWYLDTHDSRLQSTTAEKVRNKVASVSNLLEKLGVTVQGIDPKTGKAYDKTGYVVGIAQEAIKSGWDDNQLSQYLAKQAPIVFNGGGEIGSALQKIRSTAYQWGVSLSPEYEAMINTSLLDATDGRDANYYIKEMQTQALENPNNKPFLASLNSGRTLYEATRAYRGQMASLLEVDESNVSWNDLMKKTVDSTTGNARTFADFTREIKQDPMWQNTKNAKETYSNIALDLAKQFGFVG